LKLGRLSALGLTLLWGASAWALPVTLDLEGCPALDAAPVRRLVALELRVTTSPSSSESTQVRAVCPAALGSADIEVNDPLTGKSLRRTIALAAAGPAGQERLLALAIIELVSASWSELEYRAARVAPKEMVAQALQSVRSVHGGRRVAIGAAGLFHAFFAGTGMMGGAGLRLAAELPRRVVLPVELSYERADRGFEIGHATADVVWGGLGLGYQPEWTRLALRLQGGVRGGVVRLAGRPRDATVLGAEVWTAWVGPALQLTGILKVSRRAALELGVDGGWAFGATRARVVGAETLAVDGPFVGLSLALLLVAGG
jgi:hypothetical protein